MPYLIPVIRANIDIIRISSFHIAIYVPNYFRIF